MRLIYSLFVWVLSSIFTALVGITGLTYSIFAGADKMKNFTRIWGRTICFLSGVRVTVEGGENVDKNVSYLFAMNHQSFFDIFAVMGYVDIPLVWAPKKELFKIPIVGWCMRRLGFIGIDRKNPLIAMKKLEEESRSLKSKRSIIIFPEGTRTRDGSLGPFKRGLLIVVKNTGMPILPVTISGSFRVMQKGSMIINPGRIKIVIGKPIETLNISDEDNDSILENLRSTIESNLIFDYK
jgi:1-acyl-sn-glycerol-3-phosphate acyltransferase